MLKRMNMDCSREWSFAFSWVSTLTFNTTNKIVKMAARVCLISCWCVTSRLLTVAAPIKSDGMSCRILSGLKFLYLWSKATTCVHRILFMETSGGSRSVNLEIANITSK
jgi:hypothetical protein